MKAKSCAVEEVEELIAWMGEEESTEMEGRMGGDELGSNEVESEVERGGLEAEGGKKWGVEGWGEVSEWGVEWDRAGLLLLSLRRSAKLLSA